MRVYVQSVPDRDAYCSEVLVPSLEAHGLKDIRRVTDHDRHGPLWNARRIWEQIAHEDAPALILQDDVILHRDFSWHLSVIVAVMKEEGWQAVSLFAPPRADMDKFHARGHNYVENYRFLWMPGMILTPTFCAGLLNYETHHTKHDDSVVGGYSSSSGIPIWNTLPSLVQHNLDIRSTLGTASKVGNTIRATRVWDEALVPEHFGIVNSVRYGEASGMIRYYPVPVSEIQHLFPDGKKEGLSFVPNTLYMGALEDGTVIGYGGLKMHGKQATLRNLYVLPEHRGRGIAKALTAHCLDWAKKAGATTAIAFSNWNSKPLYLSMGATELESGRYYGKIRFDLGGTP